MKGALYRAFEGGQLATMVGSEFGNQGQSKEERLCKAD
jgi:hypothetical protein